MTELLLLAALAAPPRPASPYCTAVAQRIIPPSTINLTVPTALWVLRPGPSCKAGQVARVRKRSLLNAEGPYKPIFPLIGAWEIPFGTERREWKGQKWVFENWNNARWEAVASIGAPRNVWAGD